MIILIENKHPRRAILVSELTEPLECKVEQESYSESKKFSGTIRVKDVDYINIEEGIARKIISEIGFATLTNYQEFKEKLLTILPEEEYTQNPKFIKVAIDGVRDNIEIPTAKIPVLDHKAKPEVKPEIKIDPKTITNTPTIEPEPTIDKQVQQTTANQHTEVKSTNNVNQPAKEEVQPKKQEVIQPSTLPVPGLKEQIKPSDIKDAKFKDVPMQKPSNMTNKQWKNYKRELEKKEKKAVMKPRKVAMADFGDGVLLGVVANEQFHPLCDPTEDPKNALFLVFPNEGVARFLLKSLANHPKLKEWVDGATVYPVSNISIEDRELECLLITDALNYVNDLQVHTIKL